MATHCSILAWRIPWTEEPQGHKDSDMTDFLRTTLSLSILFKTYLYFCERIALKLLVVAVVLVL